MPERSILDARLAEIDRRLRTIQSGLAPRGESSSFLPPKLVPPPLEPVGDADRAARLRELIDEHERLLASARELLSSYEPASEPGALVSVSAGPFPSTEALRRFERCLAAIPEVREVVVREYIGDDRAVVEVHLSAPIS